LFRTFKQKRTFEFSIQKNNATHHTFYYTHDTNIFIQFFIEGRYGRWKRATLYYVCLWLNRNKINFLLEKTMDQRRGRVSQKNRKY
jgi:hypothetical protein